MINIPYCFPGGTIIRKIFLVSGHGPARLYCDAVCRDIFQETKVHVCPISIIFGSPKDHGSGRAFRSEEERFEKATRGEQKLRALVDKMDLSEAMKALDEYQVYIAEMQEKYPRLKGLY